MVLFCSLSYDKAGLAPPKRDDSDVERPRSQSSAEVSLLHALLTNDAFLFAATC